MALTIHIELSTWTKSERVRTVSIYNYLVSIPIRYKYTLEPRLRTRNFEKTLNTPIQFFDVSTLSVYNGKKNHKHTLHMCVFQSNFLFFFFFFGKLNIFFCMIRTYIYTRRFCVRYFWEISQKFKFSFNLTTQQRERSVRWIHLNFPLGITNITWLTNRSVYKHIVQAIRIAAMVIPLILITEYWNEYH